MKKLRKPRCYHLFRNFYLEPGERGQDLFYLVEKHETHSLSSYKWVVGRRKQKSLLIFVKKLLEWSKP